MSTARRETIVLVTVTAAMALLVLVGWLLSRADLAFGVSWVPVAVAVLIHNHTTRST